MKNLITIFTKILFGLFLIYSFIGFIILPYFVQFYIPTIIKKTIHTDSYVDLIHFNPFTFTIQISNTMIKDQNQKNLLFFEKLKVNIDPFNIVNNEIKIDTITVDNLKLFVDINKEKTTNFQYILDTFNTNNTSEKTKDIEEKQNNFLIKIDTLNLSNIRFSFEDYSKDTPFIVHTKPINLYTTDIQLKTNHTNKFDFVIDTQNTGKISLNSNLIVEPLSLEGKITLSNIAINKIFNYVKPSNITFDINSQPMNLSLDYKYSKKDTKQNIEISDINLHLEKFSYLQDPFIVQIDNLQHITKTANLQIAENISYQVANIDTKIKTIKFIDKDKNSTLSFDSFANFTENISDKKEDIIKSVQTLNTPTSGTIQANIKAIQEPLQLDITLNTKNIAIKPYEPYIKEFANLDINSGFLSNNGEIKLSNENNQTNIDLYTDINISKIDILNSINKQQFIKVNVIDISNLKYQNDALFIKKIKIDKPYIYFALNDNNSTNFSNLVPQKKDDQKTTKPQKETQKFNFDIETISINSGYSLFEDYTVSPMFSSKDTKITEVIHSISSDETKPTVITHSSIIDNYAPLLVNAKMIISNPMEALNSNIQIENIDLPSLSSYSGKFIGQKIANGKLSLNLNTSIKKSQLKSTNKLKIKDIELGETVESKDAIKAPIELAIALLEDSDGYIDLDIPIDGDINSPNFHISDVILDVITNTIVGIVSAPFKFLSMIIGLDGDDISKLEFNYGSATINVTEKEKLDNIIKAFTKRPNLKLQINSTYIQDEDTLALQKIKLKEKYPFILSSKENFDDVYKKIQAIFIKQFKEKSYDALEGEKEDKYKIMINKLQNTIQITENDLITLAQQRAQNINSYLIAKIDPSRIIINKNIQKSTKDLKIHKVLVLFEIQAK